MNAQELAEAFRNLHPRINGLVDECFDEKDGRTFEEKVFSISMEITFFLEDHSGEMEEQFFIDLGALMEKGLTEGDTFVGEAVATAMVESFCHWMQHDRKSVVPTVRHMGPWAFDHMAGYSRIMVSQNHEEWDWIKFMKKHGLEVKNLELSRKQTDSKNKNDHHREKLR